MFKTGKWKVYREVMEGKRKLFNTGKWKMYREMREKETIEIPIKYAKNIHRVLENHVSMGFAIVSQDIKDMVPKEAYEKLMKIFEKYHNANCGPFNRTLKRMIEEKENVR